MASYVIISILSYFIGSVSFSVIFGKIFGGLDVRDHGSGNAGSTNVLRTVGKKAAILTLLCDLLKGVLAVLLAFIVGNIVKTSDRALLIQLSGVFVLVGHIWPIFFNFKGGKGIATALGVLLIVNWQIGLICLLFALILMALTRMVSIGSVMAAILFPILTIFLTNTFIVKGSYLIFGVIISLIVIYKHRENIKRVLNHTENKLGNKKA